MWYQWEISTPLIPYITEALSFCLSFNASQMWVEHVVIIAVYVYFRGTDTLPAA